MEPQLVGPELFVAEGIETEDLLALGLKIRRFGPLARCCETQDRRGHEYQVLRFGVHIATRGVELCEQVTLATGAVM